MSLSLGKVLISSARLFGSIRIEPLNAGRAGIVVAVAADIHQKDFVFVFRRQPARQLFHLHPRHYPVDGMLAVEPDPIPRIADERDHGHRFDGSSCRLKAVRYRSQNIAEQIAHCDVDDGVERGSRQIEAAEKCQGAFSCCRRVAAPWC